MRPARPPRHEGRAGRPFFHLHTLGRIRRCYPTSRPPGNNACPALEPGRAITPLPKVRRGRGTQPRRGRRAERLGGLNAGSQRPRRQLRHHRLGPPCSPQTRWSSNSLSGRRNVMVTRPPNVRTETIARGGAGGCWPKLRRHPARPTHRPQPVRRIPRATANPGGEQSHEPRPGGITERPHGLKASTLRPSTSAHVLRHASRRRLNHPRRWAGPVTGSSWPNLITTVGPVSAVAIFSQSAPVRPMLSAREQGHMPPQEQSPSTR